MNGLEKIAISRLDAEIAKMPAEKAVNVIRRIYGDAISGIGAFKHTPEQRKLLALSTIKENVAPEHFNEYAKEMKGLYKKPLRKALKTKRGNMSYDYHRDEPLSQISKENRRWMLEGKKNRKVLKPLEGDPEEEIYVTHGGSKEHIERLIDRRAGGVSMNAVSVKNPSKTLRGIWAHSGDSRGVMSGFEDDAGDYYAHRGSSYSGLTPARMLGKIKRKYVLHAGGEESFIPQENMKHLKLVSITKRPPTFDQHDARTANIGEEYMRRFGH